MRDKYPGYTQEIDTKLLLTNMLKSMGEIFSKLIFSRSVVLYLLWLFVLLDTAFDVSKHLFGPDGIPRKITIVLCLLPFLYIIFRAWKHYTINQMCLPGSKLFHIHAYADLRPEFTGLNTMFEEKNITFEDIHNTLKEYEKSSLSKTSKDEDDNDVLALLHEIVDSSGKAKNHLRKLYNELFDIFKALHYNILTYNQDPESFRLKDIKLKYPFSVYRYSEDRDELIEYYHSQDVRISLGETISMSSHKNYASIKFLDSAFLDLFAIDRLGNLALKIVIGNDEKWVINLYMDEVDYKLYKSMLLLEKEVQENIELKEKKEIARINTTALFDVIQYLFNIVKQEIHIKKGS